MKNVIARVTRERAAVWIIGVWLLIFAPRALHGSHVDAVQDADAPLQFESLSAHFGERFAGERVEHRFRFRNLGDEPVSILRTSVTCGCTVADTSRRVIEPGEDGWIDAAYDTSRSLGEQRSSVFVETDIPDAAPIELQFSGTVRMAIELTPARLLLRSGADPTTLTGSLSVRAIEAISDLSASADDPEVAVDVSVGEGADAWRIDVSASMATARPRSTLHLRYTLRGSDRFVTVKLPVSVPIARALEGGGRR